MNGIKLLIMAGSWDPILQIFTNFFAETSSFLKLLSVGVVTVVLMWYKVKEIIADQQEEAQMSQKTKSVLMCFVFIFLASALVNVLKGFFSV